MLFYPDLSSAFFQGVN